MGADIDQLVTEADRLSEAIYNRFEETDDEAARTELVCLLLRSERDRHTLSRLKNGISEYPA